MAISTNHSVFYTHLGQRHFNGLTNYRLEIPRQPSITEKDFCSQQVILNKYAPDSIVHLHWDNFVVTALVSNSILVSSDLNLTSLKVKYDSYDILIPIDESYQELREFQYNRTNQHLAYKKPYLTNDNISIDSLSTDGSSLLTNTFEEKANLVYAPIRLAKPQPIEQKNYFVVSDNLFKVDGSNNLGLPSKSGLNTLDSPTNRFRNLDIVQTFVREPSTQNSVFTVDTVEFFADSYNNYQQPLLVNSFVEFSKNETLFSFYSSPEYNTYYKKLSFISKENNGTIKLTITNCPSRSSGIVRLYSGDKTDLFRIKKQKFLKRLTIDSNLLLKGYLTNTAALLDNKNLEYTVLTKASIIQKIQADKVLVLDQAYLPFSKTGFLPSKYISLAMTNYDLETIGLGLLYAVAESDEELTISILLALLNLAIDLNCLEISDISINFNPNETQRLGLPDNFSIDLLNLKPSDTCYQKTLLWSNAWLGLCVCTALRFLQDRKKPCEIKLFGGYITLIDGLKALLNFLAFSTIYSLSSVNYWATKEVHQLDDLDYSYDSAEYRSSFYSSVFLTEVLEFVYDSDIHYYAGLLYKSLSESPKEIDSSFYTYFVSETEEVDLELDYLARITSRLIWCLKFHRDKAEIEYLVTTYSFYRQELIDKGVDLPDEGLIYYLIKLAYQKELLTVLPLWLEAYFNNFFFHFSYFIKDNNPYLYPSAYLSLSQKLDLFNSKPIELYSYHVLAKLTNDFQERVRMWPYGLRWTGVQEEETNNSVLGRVLWAESKTSAMFYLSSITTLAAQNILLSIGAELQSYSRLFYKNFSLNSALFWRNWLHSYLNRERPVEKKENIVGSFNSIFDTASEILPPVIEDFYYKSNLRSPELVSSYDRTEKFDAKFISRQAYRTLTRKSVISTTVDNIESTVDEMSYFSVNQVRFIPREIPGFTYPYITASSDLIVNNNFSISSNISSNPEQEGFVVDQNVLIKPFSSVYAQITLKTAASTFDGIDKYLRDTVAFGVFSKALTKLDIVEYRTEVFLFAESIQSTNITVVPNIDERTRALVYISFITEIQCDILVYPAQMIYPTFEGATIILFNPLVQN